MIVSLVNKGLILYRFCSKRLCRCRLSWQHQKTLGSLRSHHHTFHRALQINQFEVFCPFRSCCVRWIQKKSVHGRWEIDSRDFVALFSPFKGKGGGNLTHIFMFVRRPFCYFHQDENFVPEKLLFASNKFCLIDFSSSEFIQSVRKFNEFYFVFWLTSQLRNKLKKYSKRKTVLNAFFHSPS